MGATHDRERESEGGEASGRRVGRALFSSPFHALDALRRRCGALSRSCDCGRGPKPDRRRRALLPVPHQIEALK